MQLLGSRRGEALRWLFEAACRGHAGAIIVLSLGVLAIGYTLWESVVVHLIPTPRTPKWRVYRWLGIGTLACLPLACIAFWLFIAETMAVFFLPIVLTATFTWAARKCRDAKLACATVDGENPRDAADKEK
jgi:hypothetical protein